MYFTKFRSDRNIGCFSSIKVIKVKMVSAHLEKIFFHNIMSNAAYMDVARESFFDEPILKKVFPPIKEFWDKYREKPTLAQTMELIKMKGLDKDLTPSQLETAWDCDLDRYEASWLQEHTETFIEYKNLDTSVTDLVRYLRTTPVNTENIKDVVDSAKRMVVDRNNIDFNFNEGSDFFDPKYHKQPTKHTFSSGYPYIDLVGDGGFSAKTLTIFLGQAKVGKCCHGDEYITVRNRKTGNVKKIKIKDFHGKCLDNM